MPPAYINDCTDDERRSRSQLRSKGSGGRGRRSRSERGQSNTNSCSRDPPRNRSSTSLASLRSHHHALPQDYLDAPPGSSAAATGAGGSSHKNGNKPAQASPRSPGAPPPPPPRSAVAPYSRGRNTSFHSTSTALTGNSSNRGRSLSIARNTSSSGHGQFRRSKHGEDKDGHNENESKNNSINNRRGRSLSLARPKPMTRPSSQKEEPSIDERGGRRSRSRSKSRGRNTSNAPKSRGGDGSYRAANNESPSQQESFKQVMAENSASSHRRSRSRRSGSSSRGRSTSRSRTRNSSEVSDSLTSSRKFVVEIGSNNEVVQVFEFSDQGSLPPKNNDETSKSKEEVLIENICKRYSEVRPDDQAAAPRASDRSSSRGRSSSHSRGSASDEEKKSAGQTRKIVVDIDGHEVVQVFEYPSVDNNGDKASPSSSRDESPFSMREAYAHENAKDDRLASSSDEITSKEETERPASLEDNFATEQKTSSRRSTARHRSVSASRAAANHGGALRSSLRTSLKGGRSVSFAMDNNNSGHNTSDESLNKSDKSLQLSFNMSDKSLDRSEKSQASGRSVTFMIGLDDTSTLTSSVRDDTAVYCKPCGNGLPALDTSEKSDESSRRSVSFVMDDEKPALTSLATSQIYETYQPPYRKAHALDSSERSGRSDRLDTSIRSDSSSRRAVSFLMDQQDDDDQTRELSIAQSSSMANSSNFQAYEHKQARGRSALTRSIIDDDLPEVRRVRSLSRTHTPDINDTSSLTINDTSSLTGSQGGPTTSTRGRSAASSSSNMGQNYPAPPARQTRSLSRTRHVPPIRANVDFDPPASISSKTNVRHQQQQPFSNTNYPSALRRDAPPYERVPAVPNQKPLQKSMLSYSTEETFISAMTIDTQDSFFTNHTSQAVRQEENGFAGDPFMNSTLTIFESECDEDEEESLLSDPTSLMDLNPDLPTKCGSRFQKPNSAKVYIKKNNDNAPRAGEALKQEQRRSRIRKMLSLKASSRRKTNPPNLSNPSLDISEETRETLGTEESDCFMEGAQNSLLRHQKSQSHHSSQQQSENRQGSSSSGKHQKSRLSRLLHR